MIVSQLCFIDSQTLQIIVLDFDYVLLLYRNMLSLKVPCTPFMDPRNQVGTNWEALFPSLKYYACYWKGNIIIILSTVNSVSYNNNLPGKKCHTGKKLLQ